MRRNLIRRSLAMILVTSSFVMLVVSYLTGTRLWNDTDDWLSEYIASAHYREEPIGYLKLG